MIQDRLYLHAFMASILIHALVLLLCPGQKPVVPLEPPEWIEIDLLPILELEAPEVVQGKLPGQDTAFSGGSDETTSPGNSPLFSAPPIWLPEKMNKIDVRPSTSSIFLPSNILPEKTGPGLLEPGSMVEDIPLDQIDLKPGLKAPPDMPWQPNKSYDPLDSAVDSEAFVIEGPVAERKVIFRPPLPRPVTLVSGTVSLKFWVHPDGTLGKIVPVVRGDPDLEKVSIEFLEKWRFEAIPKEAGDQWGTLPIRYRMH